MTPEVFILIITPGIACWSFFWGWLLGRSGLREIVRRATHHPATRLNPSRGEVAAIVRAHWPKDFEDPRHLTAVRCGAVGCGWEGRFPGDISEHVADLIFAGTAT